MKQKNLSFLFAERPERYGLRGDYYFWEYLEEYFALHPEFIEKEDIAGVIKEQFREKSGAELTEEERVFVAEFSKGGMSSGYLSGDFWLNTAIPLLCDRFDKAEE